ncbi:MAG: helix-turn-helix transcriptional regulator, partial [Dehalococcoidia bacterium]|nr:helix-turn-helix transcriptional regulator [Dehalococcoidia bacterium]
MTENGKDLTSAVLGNRIRQARKDAGLSQVRLAQLLNTTQSAISLYEAGQRAV